MSENGADASIVRARGLRKEYGSGEGLVRAVDEVDLEVAPGEAVAIMGPSGCGKSTLLHLLGGLDRPSAGELWLAGKRIDRLSERGLAQFRRHDVGFVFQAFHLMDELTARENVELPALLARRSPREARRRATQLLDQVGLSDRAGHLPSALSGGQRQRVAIARALVTRPKLVVADEPVSALDVSIQAQVLNLMCDLQRDAGVTYLLISHDLAVVGHVCDEIAVMFRGRFVETGTAAALLSRPAHPYTAELVSAAPKFDTGAAAPAAPAPFPDAATGCVYAPRCSLAEARCLAESPALRELADGRRVACHLA